MRRADRGGVFANSGGEYERIEPAERRRQHPGVQADAIDEVIDGKCGAGVGIRLQFAHVVADPGQAFETAFAIKQIFDCRRRSSLFGDQIEHNPGIDLTRPCPHRQPVERGKAHGAFDAVAIRQRAHGRAAAEMCDDDTAFRQRSGFTGAAAARRVSPWRRIHRSSNLQGQGRGLQSAGRFDSLTLEQVDDGWYAMRRRRVSNGAAGPRAQRDHHERFARCRIRQSINPYRGCSHGCVYCFARPDPCLSRALARPGFRDQALLQGRRGDSWRRSWPSPVSSASRSPSESTPTAISRSEKRLGVTRGILAVLARCRHPVTIVTKSALICAISICSGPREGSSGLRDGERHFADQRDQADAGAAHCLSRKRAARDSASSAQAGVPWACWSRR